MKEKYTFIRYYYFSFIRFFLNITYLNFNTLDIINRIPVLRRSIQIKHKLKDYARQYCSVNLPRKNNTLAHENYLVIENKKCFFSDDKWNRFQKFIIETCITNKIDVKNQQDNLKHNKLKERISELIVKFSEKWNIM
jgi:hypothetical protein